MKGGVSLGFAHFESSQNCNFEVIYTSMRQDLSPVHSLTSTILVKSTLLGLFVSVVVLTETLMLK